MQEPIACTLTPGAYQDRAAELARLAARALRSRERTADGERLVFTDTPDTEQELRAAIAAESSCCAFLRMDLARGEEGLVLDVAGPEDARPIIAELFAGEASPTSVRGARETGAAQPRADVRAG
jgi:hypothetical protein